MCRPELGQIAQGMQADLALFKLDELRFSGHSDPLAALVICGAHHADLVMIAGKWVVGNGRIPGRGTQQSRDQHHKAALHLYENPHS